MIIPMLVNIAVATGKLTIQEGSDHYRLVSKALGATIVLARLDKKVAYQMMRQPGMPATQEEAEALAHKVAQEPAERVAVLAGVDTPAEAPRPPRGKPVLSIVQGDRA